MNSHDVRIWEIRPFKGKKRTTYQVRWAVVGKQFGKVLATKALAESRRAELVAAQRRGEAFDTDTGRPESEMRQHLTGVSWYDHTVEYVDMMWPSLEPGTRRTLASSLATVTMALVADRDGTPEYRVGFRALVNWAYNRAARTAQTEPSEEHADAIAWLCKHCPDVSDLAQPAIARNAFNATTTDRTGKAFAPDTHRNKYKALSGAIKYAVELRRLQDNPLGRISTSPPRRAAVVDKRVVINPAQARRLLDELWTIGRLGPRHVAFFACMFFAALRPSEALALRAQDCHLPKRGWGELRLDGARPYVGASWTDEDAEEGDNPLKSLKHRPKNESRPVPACPELVAFLRDHIDRFGTAPDGRIFATEDGKPFRYGTFARLWSQTREAVFTPEQFASPLAARPYDLRHACVSIWLNAGVSPAQVAEWAGHSVETLLRTYAKCVDGQADRDRKRIQEALKWPERDKKSPENENSSSRDEGNE